MRFSPSFVSNDRCLSRPCTMTRAPRVRDSATFSAACRQMLQRRNSASPSFHSLDCRSSVRGRGRDGEVRDRRAGRGEAQFRVGGQVADHGDDGVASHRDYPSAQALAAAGLAAARLTSRRMTLVRSTVSFS